MKTITIEIPDGKRAEWIDGVLTLIDEVPKNVTERIKTFEDACCELGDEHPLVKQYFAVVEDVDENLIAYMELRIIAAALNEGWEPQFTKYEYRWLPYFDLYTQKELDEMDDDDKQKLVRLGGYATNGSHCGIGYSISYGAISSSYVNCGSRLVVKTEELAEYFGKQFIHIWKNFLIGE